VALVVLCTATSTASSTRVAAERLAFVDCMLPGTLRKLGGKMTYQGPRRPVRATVDECEIRGGEYVAYDRADYGTALKVWLPEAQKGDEVAEVYVGEIYEKGLDSGPDYAQAAEWYEKAARTGNVEAKNHLAYLYEQGLGVPRDAARAVNLYRDAAGLTGDRLVFQSEMDSKLAEFSARLQERTQALESLSAELDRTREQLDGEREAAAKAQRSADQLRAKLTRLQSQGPSAAQAPEAVGLRQQLADEEQRLTQQQGQIASLEKTSVQQASLLADRLAQSQREDARLRLELGDAQVQALTARSQLAEAQARQTALEQEAADLRGETSHLEHALHDARRAQQSTAAEKASLASELERREAVARNLDGERLQLQDQVQRLQSLLQAAQSSGQQAVQEAASLRAQIATLELQQVAKSREVADLLIHVQADTRELAEARERLAAAEKRLGAQGGAMKKLNTELEERETNLEKELARVRGLRAGVQSNQTQLSDLRAQLGTKGFAPSPAPQASVVTPLQLNSKGLGLGKSFALIIANSRYHDRNFPALPSVEKDETAVGGALQRYGFKGRMTVVENGTRDEIMNAIAAFSAQLGPDDSGLIYYTGHGAIVEANSATYWLPSDALQDIPASWVATSWVTEMIGQMRARHILVVVDSCYAGALVHSTNIRMVSRSAAEEPERIRALARLPSRTVLTSGGNAPVASNGPGGNSVFARQFTQILERNTQVLDASSLYDALSDAMNQTSATVEGLSFPQLPRYSILANTHHLNGDFVFVPRDAGT
jgi:hypothetical protein